MLTTAEKAAGKDFRAAMTYRLVHGIPDAAPCSPYIREYRHDCSAHGGVSWPLRLKEHVRESPEYEGVPAGRFTFTWVDGRCGCGLVVRSTTGKLAVT